MDGSGGREAALGRVIGVVGSGAGSVGFGRVGIGETGGLVWRRLRAAKPTSKQEMEISATSTIEIIKLDCLLIAMKIKVGPGSSPSPM
ncbi:hypothetical protein V2J09_009154 [Rumex salicifolius]